MSGAWQVVACLLAAFLAWPAGSRAERPLFVTEHDQDPDDPLAVATAMEMLALALAGGAPNVVALEAVSEARSPGLHDGGEVSSSGILAQVAAALRWGVEERSAWAAAGSRWRPAATAFEMSTRCGAAPAELLRQAATDLRVAETERIATAGAKAGVRIVLPLGLCFLPAFVLIAVVPLVMGLVDLPT